MDKSLTIALVLAGGHGHRMCSDRPKQFLEVAGKPMIHYVLRTLDLHPQIDRIYVVCAPKWNTFVEATAREGGISKFRSIFPSGETSIDSVRNSVMGLLEEYGDTNPTVLTHESVRPLLTENIITENLKTFHAFGNAVTAVRSHEAYMVSADGTYSEESIPRELLYRAQTPITFTLNALSEAFKKAGNTQADKSQSLYTMMAEVYPEKKLYIAPGAIFNYKITLPEDIETLEAILARREQS